MKTATSTLSYHSPFIFVTCICRRAAAPTKLRDTKVTMTTATAIARFRRRPDPTWESTNCQRMPYLPAP